MDMEAVDVNYFLECPKGRCLESHVRKNFPELYTQVLSLNGTKFLEKLYRHFHPTKDNKCIICGSPTRLLSFSEGFARTCCISCSKKDPEVINKTKATMLEKYGVENASQAELIKEKKRWTSKRNGTIMGFANPKIKDTIKERYGVENASQAELIKEKKRQTSLKNYGVDVPSKSPEVQQKMEHTKQERYGDKYYNNREQAIQTNLDRYGVDNVFRLKEVFIKSHEARIAGDSYQKVAAANTSRAIERHPNVISCKNGIYTCSCHHSECKKCTEKQFQIPIGNYHARSNMGAELCTILHPIGLAYKNTYIENFIKDILDEHNINYIQTDRKILAGRELDFYLPDYNIAIECNGVYWHSNEYKDPTYHHKKYSDCLNLNIQLITIWEDQVRNNPDKIKNIILSKVGKYTNRVYARQCALKEISKQESNFILQHHLQGPGQASIRYGLYFKEELVSVMTFAKGRIFVGGEHHRTEYELIRFCNKPGWQVVGGASKLLSHFTKQHDFSLLVSYSSNDISTGNLYQQLGFNKVRESDSYWYINPNNFRRHHRFNFRKSELIKQGYDKNKSEREITKELGMLRINDSGQTRWEYIKEES